MITINGGGRSRGKGTAEIRRNKCTKAVTENPVTIAFVQEVNKKCMKQMCNAMNSGRSEKEQMDYMCSSGVGNARVGIIVDETKAKIIKKVTLPKSGFNDIDEARYCAAIIELIPSGMKILAMSWHGPYTAGGKEEKREDTLFKFLKETKDLMEKEQVHSCMMGGDFNLDLSHPKVRKKVENESFVLQDYSLSPGQSEFRGGSKIDYFLTYNLKMKGAVTAKNHSDGEGPLNNLDSKILDHLPLFGEIDVPGSLSIQTKQHLISGRLRYTGIDQHERTYSANLLKSGEYDDRYYKYDWPKVAQTTQAKRALSGLSSYDSNPSDIKCSSSDRDDDDDDDDEDDDIAQQWKSPEKYFEKVRLGRDGFGVALLVKPLDGSKPYVVKKMRSKITVTKEISDEAAFLCTLQHPRIAEYHDYFIVDGILHMVMGYCARGNLAAVIDARITRFEQKEVFPFWRQLLAGLEFLHNNGIIVRNLTPNNILVTDTGYYVISDYALTKLLSAEEIAKINTGDEDYMSPEMKTGKKWTEKVDSWSLGCCGMKFMALKLPNHEYLLQFGKLQVEPKWIRKTDFCIGLINMLRACLIEDPSDRSSVRQLSEVLDTIDGTSSQTLPRMESTTRNRNPGLAAQTPLATAQTSRDPTNGQQSRDAWSHSGRAVQSAPKAAGFVEKSVRKKKKVPTATLR